MIFRHTEREGRKEKLTGCSWVSNTSKRSLPSRSCRHHCRQCKNLLPVLHIYLLLGRKHTARIVGFSPNWLIRKAKRLKLQRSAKLPRDFVCCWVSFFPPGRGPWMVHPGYGWPSRWARVEPLQPSLLFSLNSFERTQT